MRNHSVKPDVAGTRSGCAIRFTCPLCSAENSIINKTPRDHYKETRDASCLRCRKHFTVVTPGMHQKPERSPAPVSVKFPVIK